MVAKKTREADYWRNRRECGVILRYFAASNKWMGLTDLQYSIPGMRSRTVSFTRSVFELYEAGLLRDRWVSVPGFKGRFRQYQLAPEGTAIAA